MPIDWPPLKAHPPFVRVLLSDFVTMPPMSWHGKAEEPMVLGGREGSAVALDARQPSLWTSVVRQGVVCSCAAVADVFWQLSAAIGMPVWWALRHGDVARQQSCVVLSISEL